MTAAGRDRSAVHENSIAAVDRRDFVSRPVAL
jgi:hypothetical protein